MNKRCLTLDEKIKILDDVKKRKLSCRAIAEEFKIGITQTANVVKNEAKLREEYENFQGKGFKYIKSENHQKFKPINDSLCSWFKKRESAGIYVNGPLLKEEAMNIKQSLNLPELDDFKASEGWLDKWKLSHGIKEKQISGESLDVSQTTVESWMERIKELCKGYDQRNILNMDESGCFFKALPAKGLAQKGKNAKGGKKSKQRITVAFFVSADMYSNIKIVFLPKNTTSRLQPLDAGIIQSFKTKSRKKLMRYVIARINDDLTASEIAKGINILQAITWVADSWKEVSVETIKNCFAKCGITDQIGQDEDDLVDEEFNSLFNELVDPECDMTAEEYADFDIEKCSSLPPINSDMVDWRVSSVKACVTEYLQKECGDVNEVALDSDDDKDNGNDKDDNEDNSKVVQIGTREALEMLDRLVNLKDLTKEERNSLVAMKDKLEIITIQNRKQSRIYDFFVC